jgi:hypothetical protein
MTHMATQIVKATVPFKIETRSEFTLCDSGRVERFDYRVTLWGVVKDASHNGAFATERKATAAARAAIKRLAQHTGSL